MCFDRQPLLEKISKTFLFMGVLLLGRVLLIGKIQYK